MVDCLAGGEGLDEPEGGLAQTAPETALRHYHLPGAVDLFVYPTSRFKTTLVNVLFHRELDGDTSAAALVPYLLRRGTEDHSDMVAIARHLERLFGASLDVEVRRFGERQTLSFRLDVVDDRYLFLGGRDLLRQGLQLLRDVILRPALDEGAFPESAFLQERVNLKRYVESLANDKGRYALDRCIRHMCVGEPYARSEYGEADEIADLVPSDAKRVWEDVLRQAPMEIYVVGSTAPDRVRDLCGELFGGVRGEFAATDATRPVPVRPGRIRRIRETEDVVQARLVMGFRTDIAFGDRRSLPLAVWNTIYGSGPFSRLFREVREKHSLAYYCSSHADQSKGVLFVQAGTDPEACDRVERLVRRQMGEMNRGSISLDDLKAAKAYLRANVLATTDSPSRIAAFFQERRAIGSHVGQSEILRRLQQVRRSEVCAAGATLVPDTYYRLTRGNE